MAKSLRVMMLITPPVVPPPYWTEPLPRTISMRSTWSSGTTPRLGADRSLVFCLTPSIRISVLLAPVMPKPRKSTMALSLEPVVLTRWMPACVDSRSCMVRALLASMSWAVMTEMDTGSVRPSVGTRWAVTVTASSWGVEEAACWAAARAGAEQSRAPA
ncbi:hypothetical protein D9M68_552800 [compost metagenome]